MIGLLLLSHVYGQTAEDCFLVEKDYGTGADIAEVNVESYWDCYAQCKNYTAAGCTHFTFMDSIKTCFLKNSGEPFSDYSWGTVTAALSCFKPYENQGEAVSSEPPYTAEECFEENAIFDESTKLEESLYYPVVGTGFADPNWCQIHCTSVPECNFFQYVFWPGNYGSEAAQDVDRAACYLFNERIAAPKGLEHQNTYIGGPRVCPGGWSDQGPPAFDAEGLLDGKTVTMRLNAGGPQFQGHTGTWDKDAYYSETGFQHAYQVDSYWFFAAMDPLAQTNRHFFEYAIPLPVEEGVNVNANIKLYFVENIVEYAQARSFNVTVEGKEVLFEVDPYGIAAKLMNKSDNYDELVANGWSVYAQAQTPFGTITSISLPLQVIEDGVLNIGHVAQWGDPTVCLVEVSFNISKEPRASITSTNAIIPVGKSASSLNVTKTLTNYGTIEDIDLSDVQAFVVEGGSEVSASSETATSNDLNIFKDKCTFTVGTETLAPGASTDLTVNCSDTSWMSDSIKSALINDGDATGPVLVVRPASGVFIPVVPVDNESPGLLTTFTDMTDFGFVPPVSAGNARTATAQFKNSSATESVTVNSISIVSVNDSVAEESGITIYQKNFGSLTSATGTMLPFSGPVEVEAGAIFGIRVTFAPDSVGLSYATIIVNTDQGTYSHIVVGECVDTTEPHFLHPVLTLDDFTVDYSGTGSVDVALDGSFSHTHEPGRSVVGFEWVVDGVMLDQNVSVPITNMDVGVHSIVLTIIDDEGKRLNTVAEKNIYTPDDIGGAITFLYVARQPGPLSLVEPTPDSYVLDSTNPSWVARTSVFGYEVDTLSQNIAGSTSISKEAVVRIIGSWTADPRFFSDGQVKICAKTGLKPTLFVNEELVTINGDCFHVPKTTVDEGPLRLDVRWPVSTTSPTGNSLCAVVANDCIEMDLKNNFDIAHDETHYSPFITSIEPKIVDVAGNADVTINGFFIPNGDGITVEYSQGATSTVSSVVAGKNLVTKSPTGQAEGTQSVTLKKDGVTGGSTSNAKIQFMDGAPPPIEFTDMWVFDSGAEEGGIKFPTQIEWGHDGYVYVATFGGEIVQFEYDANNKILPETKKVFDIIARDFPNTDLNGVELGHTNVGANGVGPNAILGIVMDPFSDPKAPHIYVASSPMFAQGGSCFDFATVHAPFSARIDRVYGPNYDTRETILENIAISNHDHGVNGMVFDNDGKMYWLQGVQTNFGWPTCILGGLPESHYTGGLNRLDIRDSWHRKIDYVDWATGEWDFFPNQVVGDMLAPAPWMTGIETFAGGFRNCFDQVFTQSGRFFVTQNGFNEGYGQIVDGKPDCDFLTWDVMMGGYENPYSTDSCRPPVREEFSEPDRLFEAFEGSWHGNPNPPYARNNNLTYEWTAKDAFAPNDPPNFYQGLAFTPSLVGVTEWKGNCFKGSLRGDLLMQKWNGLVYRADIPDEQRPLQMSDVTVMITNWAGLDVQHGPGCTLLATDFTGNRLMWAEAVEPNTKPDKADIFDVFPWRGDGKFELPIRISGRNFNDKGTPKSVVISGVEATSVELLSDTVIIATTPVHDTVNSNLGTVSITWSDDSKSIMESAFLWRSIPDPFDITNPDQMPKSGPADLDYGPTGIHNPTGEALCGIRNANFIGFESSPISTLINHESSFKCRESCEANPDCNMYRHNRTTAISPVGLCELFSENFYEVVEVNGLEESWTTEIGPGFCRYVSTTTTTTTTTTTATTTTTTATSTTGTDIGTTVDLGTDESGNPVTTTKPPTVGGTTTGTSSAEPSSTSTTNEVVDEESGLTGGAVTGIAIGSVAAVGLMGGLIAGLVAKNKKAGSAGPTSSPNTLSPTADAMEDGPTPRRPFAAAE